MTVGRGMYEGGRMKNNNNPALEVSVGIWDGEDILVYGAVKVFELQCRTLKRVI